MAPNARCAGCGIPADGAYCPHCGTPAPRPSRDRRAWVVAWVVAGVAVALVVVGVVRGAPEPAVPSMGSATAGAGTFPDISGLADLTPREQFDQLFDRMMRAGTEGDSGTVAHLSPLAADAYSQLDSLDADTRFHAGLIAIQIGNFAGARALADTIEGRDPRHLFGPILLGALARLEGDTAGFNAAVRTIHQRAETELARTDRPEYIEHAQLLTEVRQAAEIK